MAELSSPFSRWGSYNLRRAESSPPVREVMRSYSDDSPFTSLDRGAGFKVPPISSRAGANRALIDESSDTFETSPMCSSHCQHDRPPRFMSVSRTTSNMVGVSRSPNKYVYIVVAAAFVTVILVLITGFVITNASKRPDIGDSSTLSSSSAPESVDQLSTSGTPNDHLPKTTNEIRSPRLRDYSDTAFSNPDKQDDSSTNSDKDNVLRNDSSMLYHFGNVVPSGGEKCNLSLADVPLSRRQRRRCRFTIPWLPITRRFRHRRRRRDNDSVPVGDTNRESDQPIDRQLQLPVPLRSCVGVDMMRCSDNTCAVRCDGRVDCADLADEYQCTCGDRTKRELRCDAYPDCPDESDELGCGDCEKNSMLCSTKHSASDIGLARQCFSIQQQCDGLQHCNNGRDEVLCVRLTDSILVSPQMSYVSVLSSGYLQRRIAGQWLPVCYTSTSHATEMADSVCRFTMGRFNEHPTLSLLPRNYPAEYSGRFITALPVSSSSDNNHDQLIFEASSSCSSQQAVHVSCRPPPCGLFTGSLVDEIEAMLEQTLRAHQSQNLPSARVLAFKKELATNTASALGNASYNQPANYHGGRRRRSHASKIVGGRRSRAGRWSWLVGVFRDGEFSCGGSIISRDWVLSAAHCVHRFSYYYYEVQAGMLRRNSIAPYEQTRMISHIVVHPDYDRNIFSNDIALLHLASPLQLTRWSVPVCLPDFDRTRGGGTEDLGRLDTGDFGGRYGDIQDLDNGFRSGVEDSENLNSFGSRDGDIQDLNDGFRSRVDGLGRVRQAPIGQLCSVAGWGQVSEDGPESDDMLETEVPVLATCPETYDNITLVLCAGRTRGGHDSCQGDSGGPLMCKTHEGQWVQHGIVSHGRGCAQPKFPGVYTRVSYFVHWIAKITSVNAVNLGTEVPQQRCRTTVCRLGGGQCLKESHVCDGHVHCLHAEDERFCGENGAEIVPQHLINSNSTVNTATNDANQPQTIGNPVFSEDVGDISAAPLPPPHGNSTPSSGSQALCDDNQFRCLRLPVCVSVDRVCDGHPDCGDYSDEVGCSLIHHLARQYPQRLCDAHVDLPNAADEHDCCLFGQDRFYCFLSNETVPSDWQCDGQVDCPHAEDEFYCVALINSPFTEIQLDNFGRPLTELSGVVAVKSRSGKWRPTCVDPNYWLSTHSDIICDFLHQSLSERHQFVDVSDAPLTEQHPHGDNVFSCRRGHNALRHRHHNNLNYSSFASERRTAEHTQRHSSYMRHNSSFSRVLSLLHALTQRARGRQLFGDNSDAQHSSCGAVQLTCVTSSTCGRRPMLASHHTTSPVIVGDEDDDNLMTDPVSGVGVWPMFCTLYLDGVRRLGGATLLSQHWALTHTTTLSGVSSQSYVTAVCGQHKHSLFSSHLQQTRRVDLISSSSRSSSGFSDVCLVHFSRPLETGPLVYPACSPLSQNSGGGDIILAENTSCYAIGWLNDRVSAVKLRVISADFNCQSSHLLCFSLNQCQPGYQNWSGSVVCQIPSTTSTPSLSTSSALNLWRVVAMFDQLSCQQPVLSADSSLVRLPAVSERVISQLMHCGDLQRPMPGSLHDLLHHNMQRECEDVVRELRAPECIGHRCVDGRCLHPTQVCNGVPDCSDAGDEIQCSYDVTACHHDNNTTTTITTTSTLCDCPDGRMRCADSGTCWPAEAYCDGQAGCLDGSDEPDLCTCSEYLWLTSPSLICDGHIDCADDGGSDELDCHYQNNNNNNNNNNTHYSGQFRCYRSPTVRMLSRRTVCDGRPDCAAGEDEQHCVCLQRHLPALIDNNNNNNNNGLQATIGYNVTENSISQPAVCESEGYLLMRLRGSWLVVDHNMWTRRRSQRVCAKLGYSSVVRDQGQFPPDGGEIRLVYIVCAL